MKYRKLKAPISVQVEITESCNNDCSHCYNHWRDKNNIRPKSLKKEELLFIVEQLIENQVFSVTLTGGEPLILWRMLPRAIDQLTSAGINVSLNSNLTLLDAKKAYILKKSGLKSFLVSVLSDDEGIHDNLSNHQGSWQKTINGIKIAVSRGFRVSANMVLLRQNFNRIYKTADFLKRLGVKCFSATKASPALNSRNFDNLRITKEQLRESLELLVRVREELNIQVDILECYPLCLMGDFNKFRHFVRRSCTAGITTCTIGADGEVRPCSHSDMIYGNIFTESLVEIWDRMSDWRNGEYIPDECSDCKFLSLCSGGCRMEAKYLGDIEGKDPYMTSPNEVIFNSEENNHPILDITTKYAVANGFSCRQENFGAVVKTNFSEPILVDFDGYRMLKEISSQKNFTLAQFFKKGGALEDKAVVGFLNSLIERKIILPARKAR